MNSVRSNYLSLKYQEFTPSGCSGIGIIKFEFVAKTQLLYEYLRRNGFAKPVKVKTW